MSDRLIHRPFQGVVLRLKLNLLVLLFLLELKELLLELISIVYQVVNLVSENVGGFLGLGFFVVLRAQVCGIDGDVVASFLEDTNWHELFDALTAAVTDKRSVAVNLEGSIAVDNELNHAVICLH